MKPSLSQRLDQCRKDAGQIAKGAATAAIDQFEGRIAERIDRLEKKLDAIGMMLASMAGEEVSVEGGDHEDAR